MRFDATAAAAKFLSRLDRSGPPAKDGLSPCWVWGGFRHKSGHGQVSFGRGRPEYTHRLSWELHNGPVPEGMCVCHKCDVPACCNPEHMFLGTRADNMRDMWAKARGVHSNNVEQCVRSRRLANALSDEAVRACVLIPFAMGATVKAICAATGLGPQCVRGLISGRTRKVAGVSDEEYAANADGLIRHRARAARHAA